MNDSSRFARLSSVTPDQVRGYLVHGGWVEDGELGNVATIWHRSPAEGYEHEVIAPKTTASRDYTSRINDLLLNLANFEEREVERVFEDISRFYADTIRIRVAHADVKEGTIPLEDGVLLMEKAREVLTSAALSTLSKRRYFSGNKPQRVSEFIRMSRLGQTEVGSYIINIIAPLSQSEDGFIDDLPFARLVTNTLSVSLSEAKKIVDSPVLDTSSGELDVAVDKGVSANLFDSLIGLSGDKKNRDFSISISFAKSREVNSAVFEEFSFNAANVPRLERASEYLKDYYTIENFNLSGLVTALKREKLSSDGHITVSAVIDDHERNISIELQHDDYLKAIHAHENKRFVECIGDVHVGPRSANLTDARGFRVVPANDLFEDS